MVMVLGVMVLGGVLLVVVVVMVVVAVVVVVTECVGGGGCHLHRVYVAIVGVGFESGSARNTMRWYCFVIHWCLIISP